MNPTRPYRMKARATSAAETRERILEGAVGLLKVKFRAEIRLPEIAAAAGVTAQTVLNVFGTKDAVLAQALQDVIQRASSLRRAAAPDDIEGAIHGLYRHYECIGDWVIRNLMEEADTELLEIGRARHREWGEIYFGPHLAGRSGLERRRRMDALLACCDVYNWRLLRRDLGRSAKEAEATVLLTVRAILAAG